jgi:hypothetical protein
MALVVKDRVQETTTTTGTGTLTLLGAVTGFQSFASIGNANTTYYTISSTSSEWEVGIGTYTASGTTLSRDTILSSSNAGSAVNLSAGTKNVYVTYPAGYSVRAGSNNANSEFAATTALVFYQAAAPTGWTKSTTNNDKALRVVSGAGGSAGGTTAFSSVFTNQTPTGSVAVSLNNTTAAGTVSLSAGGSVGLSAGGSVSASTLSTAQLASHAHSLTVSVGCGYPGTVRTQGNCGGGGSGSVSTDANGSGGSHTHGFTNPTYSLTNPTYTFGGTAHTHTISSQTFTGSALTLNVQYIDTIICTKD